MAEKCGEAPHDGKSKSHAPMRGRRRPVAPHLEELFEDTLAILARNADAGVDDVDCNAPATATGTDPHAAPATLPTGAPTRP